MKKTNKIKELANKLLEIPNVVSVYENFNEARKGMIFLAIKLIILQEKEYIVEQIGNIKYNLTPTTFFQLNPIQTEKNV
ncbi:MAG: hypothetical protein L6U99_01335 [Clostridium sp.]|nr:MAG: hypothetical protein L6U99_01335 [Clostridium sp.]